MDFALIVFSVFYNIRSEFDSFNAGESKFVRRFKGFGTVASVLRSAPTMRLVGQWL